MKTSLSTVKLPVSFAVLGASKKAPKDWSDTGKVTRAAARKFGVSFNVAVGLVKFLQGPITLFGHRLAEVAFIQLYSPLVQGKARTNLLHQLRLTEFDLLGYTTEQISVYVHQFFADAAEACLTEVLMDRRKYEENDPDRYDKALKAIMDLIAGRAKGNPLDPADVKDGEGNHIHKGETTVNVEAINALMATIKGETINRLLACYPVTNSLVGKLNDTKVIALARAIDGSDMDDVLDIINKRKVEGFVPIAPPTLRDDKKAYPKVREFYRQHWNDNVPAYVQQAIFSANTNVYNGKSLHPIYVEVLENRIKVVYCHPLLPFMHVQGIQETNGLVFTCPLPDFRERVSTDYEVGGFFVHEKGVDKAFARHGLMCLNTNVVKQLQNGEDINKVIRREHIQLVTVMDVLAHGIVNHLDALNGTVYGMNKRNEPFTEAWCKQQTREFRTGVKNVLGKYVRPIGVDHHDDGVIYDAVDMLPLQASLQVIEAAPEMATEIVEHMLKIIANSTYTDPIRPDVAHAFCVGAAPKGGSFAHITKMHGNTGRTLVELVGQPCQHNTDRGQREASGLATAWPLLKTRRMIRTIWDGYMPELLTRATDLVYAYVPSDKVFTNGSGKDTDAIYATTDGIEATAYTPKQAKYGPYTPEVADDKAKKLTGNPNATVETLRQLGWDIQTVNRFQGYLDAQWIGRFVPGANKGQDMVDVYTQHYVLVDPNPMPVAKGRKLGWCGTKSVAVPLGKRFYFVMGGVRIYVDVICAIETMEQKKLQGDVNVGQGVLLQGTHTFDGTETPEAIEDYLEDLKAVKSPKNGSIIYRTTDAGTEKEKHSKYIQFPLYDEDGNNMGACIPAVHRTFVMKENETLAHRQHANSMSQSPWAVNLFGGDIKMPTYEKTCIEMLAGLVARGADLEDQRLG